MAEQPQSARKIEPHVWRIAIVVILGAIMSVLDTTIVNVALDTLARDLGVSLDTIQWVASGYLLSLAAVIPITGWLGRRFGARRVFLTALVLFTAGSALCGLATSAGIADLLPRPAGHRRRHADADRPDDPRQGRRASEPAARDERDRRPDHPRPRLRPDARRPAARARLLAVDLPRQRARSGSSPSSPPGGCCPPTSPRTPGASTCSASASSQPGSSASPTASPKPARTTRCSPAPSSCRSSRA